MHDYLQKAILKVKGKITRQERVRPLIPMVKDEKQKCTEEELAQLLARAESDAANAPKKMTASNYVLWEEQPTETPTETHQPNDGNNNRSSSASDSDKSSDAEFNEVARGAAAFVDQQKQQEMSVAVSEGFATPPFEMVYTDTSESGAPRQHLSLALLHQALSNAEVNPTIPAGDTAGTSTTALTKTDEDSLGAQQPSTGAEQAPALTSAPDAYAGKQNDVTAEVAAYSVRERYSASGSSTPAEVTGTSHARGVTDASTEHTERERYPSSSTSTTADVAGKRPVRRATRIAAHTDTSDESAKETDANDTDTTQSDLEAGQIQEKKQRARSRAGGASQRRRSTKRRADTTDAEDRVGLRRSKRARLARN